MSSYESIKSIIRVLLTSSSNGLTLDQLNSDYKRYNQSTNIPYDAFGYSSLVNFLCSMPDIAQFDKSSSFPTIYAVNTVPQNKHFRERCPLSTLSLSKVTESRSFGYHEKRPVSSFHRATSSLADKKVKPVKRLALQPLSTNTRRYDRSSNPATEQLTRQLIHLAMNKTNASMTLSENAIASEISPININSMNKCQVVRYSNGKSYLPCFELARILDINENQLNRETMLSRVRVYSTNPLFNQLEKHDHFCEHRHIRHRPYFFLFLIPSVLSLLRMKPHCYQYQHLIFPLERSTISM